MNPQLARLLVILATFIVVYVFAIRRYGSRRLQRLYEVTFVVVPLAGGLLSAESSGTLG